MPLSFKHLTNHQEADVIQIIQSALKMADPYLAVFNQISLNENMLEICGNAYILENLEKIYLVGAGKAVVPMAAAVMDKIGEKITAGVIISKHQNSDLKIHKKIQVLYGSHPIPSESSVTSSLTLKDLLTRVNTNDLVIVLISGGGSALMTLPKKGLNLSDVQSLTQELLRCGATIQEINTIRKQTDEIKGGGLAWLAGDAKMETLVLSDVIGNDLSIIASGPTVPDSKTFADAIGVVEKYGIADLISNNIYRYLKAGKQGEKEETLKPENPLFSNKHTYIVASLNECVLEAEKTAKDLGYKTISLSNRIQGEARWVGKNAASILKLIADYRKEQSKPILLIGGGETTVTLKGDGRGGRNQEIAFGALRLISGFENCVLIAFATDGEDGPTEAAGAYVTGDTFRAATDLGLDVEEHGRKNDTYIFFKKLDSLIFTGPTGTNVNDLLFIFVF